MNNIYIIESPFQLLSAIESNENIEGKSLLIIKYTNMNKNDYQIRKIKEKLSNFNNIIEVFPKFSNLDADFQLLYILKKIKKNYLNTLNIFIGEYRSFHMRKFFDHFELSNCYLLDDGNITLEINEKYLKLGLDYFSHSGWKGYLKKIIYKLQLKVLNLESRRIRRDINLYTCFDINPISSTQIIIKHNFEFLRKCSKEKKVTKKVYFYGANISGLNIDITLEKKYLLSIKQFYLEKGIQLVYLPHRKESQKKIDVISNELLIEIYNSEFPAEIELLLSDELPSDIASYFSTTLITLPLLYDFDNVISFFPDISKLNESLYKEILAVKNEYKTKMKVIELNEIS